MYNLDSLANKINKKLYFYPLVVFIITFFVLTIVVVINYNYIQNQELDIIKQKILNKEKSTLKQRVHNAIDIIKYNQNSTERILKRSIKEKIYEAVSIIKKLNYNESQIVKLLSSIRFFDNRGYYFIYNYSTNRVIYHPRKEFINKDMTKFKDKKGQILVKLYDKVMNNKKREGFADIYFKKPFEKDSKEYKKVVFVKYIPKLNWVIGTGEYLDIVDNFIQKQVLQLLENIKFSNNGYFWVNNSKGKLLMHPYMKDYIGKNIIDLKDAKGNYIIKFIKKAKEAYPNGIFVKYYWKKINSNKIMEKIGYIKYFKEWDWIIGSGIYIEDINNFIDKEKEKIIKRQTKHIIFIGLVLLFIFIIVLIFTIKLSNNINSYFKKYSSNTKEINNILEEKVKERTKELNALNHSLEEKIKVEVEKNRQKDLKLLEQSKFVQIGEMIENIAHQWRQPLSVISTISTSIEFKLEQDIKLDNQELLDNVNHITKTTNYLSNTIDQFRNFIKEERQVEIIDVKHRIEQALSIVQAGLKFYNIDIIKSCEDNLKVRIVKGELIQVVINIINNAKDILKTKDNPWIKIDCFKENNFIIITIEDNGGGIPKDIIDKIFNPYFTTKHKSQGTGIGLYMSKKIIEQNNNGELSVINTQNGAKFYIKLKAIDEEI